MLALARQAPAAERVGTYDSRVVAFAAFWSEAGQARLQATLREARTAKEEGNDARYRALARVISARQQALHLQVFSTAPADDALAQLGDRVAEIQREAGVTRIVSQWDAAALTDVPTMQRVDLTDQLVREFHVPEVRSKHLDQLRAAKPLPLWLARLMSWLDLL